MKTRGAGGLWGAEGQGCEGPCAGEELAPGHVGLPPACRGVESGRVWGQRAQAGREGAVALEVMGGSVCPPAECLKWVSGQLALGSLGDLGMGSPHPRLPPPSLGLLETQAASLHPPRGRRCLFPETLSLEVRTGGGVTRMSSESELLNHQDGPCHPLF